MNTSPFVSFKIVPRHIIGQREAASKRLARTIKRLQKKGKIKGGSNLEITSSKV